MIIIALRSFVSKIVSAGMDPALALFAGHTPLEDSAGQWDDGQSGRVSQFGRAAVLSKNCRSVDGICGI